MRRPRQLENHRVKLSTIVERSPLYRFLDQSRAALLKLQPIWQSWLAKKLPQLDASAAHLSTYDAKTKTVTINANNASTAALLKHQRDSLMNALLAEKIISIQQIKIRIDLVSTSAAAELQQKYQKHAEGQYGALARQQIKPNEDAIESVERLQSSVNNPELADTLGNLADTLKNLANKPNQDAD